MTHPKDRTALELERDPAYAYLVHGLLDLPGAWLGWRLRGRHLVSPHGDRISPARLRGILFLEAMQKRLARGRLRKNRQVVIEAPQPGTHEARSRKASP